MPARSSIAVMNGKKTLSDSEVLAYSKNRFVEYKLRRKVRELSDQEQVCHDKHQQEIFRWKTFMRQSTKHSGVWLLDSDGEDGAAGEENPEPVRSSVQRVDAGSRADDCGGKTPQRGNPSMEMARSLTFRSEALSQLQKPWAYTYSAASHNTVYKEAQELTQIKKKRLYLRRTLSASVSSADVNRSFSRNRSTEGENLHDSRPFTARSMPGTLQGGKPQSDSQDGSTAFNSRRPKTSMGIVRIAQKQAKVAVSSSERGIDRNGSFGDKTDGGITAELPVSGTKLASDSVEENMTTAIFDIAGDKGNQVFVPSEQKNENKEKLPVLVGKLTLDDPHVKESVTGNDNEIDAPVMNANSKEQKSDVHVNSSETEVKEWQSTQPLVGSNPVGRPQKNSTKHVHIVLDEEQLPINENNPECNGGSQTGSAEPSQLPGKEETARSEGAATTEDNTTSALKVVACSDQPNYQPEDKADKELTTVVGKVVRIREFQSKSAGLNRRRSQLANLGCRRQSFIDIADQLEALRYNNGHRQLRADDDEDEDENIPKEASQTPNEVSVLNGAKDSSSKPPAIYSRERPTTETKSSSHHIQQQTRANSNVDCAEVTPQNPKSVKTAIENRPRETHTPQPDKTIGPVTDPATNDPAIQLPLELEEDYDAVDFFPSDQCSFAGSDYTVFKGFKIRNYTRPQLRYLGDPFLSSRRERSLIRLSVENPVCLNGNRGDMKSNMLFPKTCRQKVLQELVHRNNQPPPVHDAGVVPPELRAKIDEFFKTIEPFCLKPEEGTPD